MTCQNKYFENEENSITTNSNGMYFNFFEWLKFSIQIKGNVFSNKLQ